MFKSNSFSPSAEILSAAESSSRLTLEVSSSKLKSDKLAVSAELFAFKLSLSGLFSSKLGISSKVKLLETGISASDSVVSTEPFSIPAEGEFSGTDELFTSCESSSLKTFSAIF